MPRKYTITPEERERRRERMRRTVLNFNLEARGKHMNDVMKKRKDQLREENDQLLHRLNRANEILQQHGIDAV